MWIRYERFRAPLRLALSGLVAGVVGTTPIPAAMQGHELCTEVVESADGARRDKAALIYGLMLDDQQHAVASELAHKLALRDLRTRFDPVRAAPAARRRTGRR